MATQAMPLYSNLNYPNLKNEVTDLSERFKHVTKMWRKLDGPTKLIYVNKSRQNRYKKKSDEKITNGTAKSVSKYFLLVIWTYQPFDVPQTGIPSCNSIKFVHFGL